MRSVQSQGGFTFVELVTVIVILGILAATAVPKFINVSANARTAAVAGVAGGLESATAINYGGRSVLNTNGVAVTTCTTAASTLTAGALPANYSFSNGAKTVANGVTTICTINFVNNGVTATAVANITGIT
jgi:prepilin-type N-terminal cleavage/methylation domain-containing protein